MTRMPLEMLNAAIANLTMAEQASKARYLSSNIPHIMAECNGEGRAFRESIALLRCEFATLLAAPLIITNGQ